MLLASSKTWAGAAQAILTSIDNCEEPCKLRAKRQISDQRRNHHYTVVDPEKATARNLAHRHRPTPKTRGAKIRNTLLDSEDDSIWGGLFGGSYYLWQEPSTLNPIAGPMSIVQGLGLRQIKVEGF